MKKISLPMILSGVVLGMLLAASGCTKGCQQQVSHVKSNLIGLNRTITLYAVDGSVIKSWEGRFQVETGGSSARFIHEGKAVYISGTFVIEER
ncbi:MAG: hypothetical protein R3231_04115 [bacterium]|nr:hypothetical protein [bacterium]